MKQQYESVYENEIKDALTAITVVYNTSHGGPPTELGALMESFLSLPYQVRYCFALESPLFLE